MKYNSIFPGAALAMVSLLGLAACSETSTEDKLIGLWQETEVINPQMDQMISEQQIFIDTIGRGTTPAQNLTLYGTANVDSLKERLSSDLANAKTMRKEAIENTRFEFLTGKLMVIHAGTNQTDSCSWTVEDDGALLLDGKAGKDEPPMHLRFEILALNDTMLKLQYNEKFLSSTTVFRPVKK